MGTVAEIQAPLEKVESFRKEAALQNWRRLKIKILSIVRFRGCLSKAVQDSTANSEAKKKTYSKRRSSSFSELSARIRHNTKETIAEVKEGAKNKAARWGKKVRGGSAGIPPSFTWRQVAWTFIGVITTHSILSRISLLISTESDFQLALAPFGTYETR